MQPRDIAGRQITQQQPQRMVVDELVIAVGQDQQGGSAVYASGQVFDEIERCLVGPVDVFDHQDGGRARNIVEKGSEERRTVRLALEQHAQRGSGLLGDVIERAQWTRRKQGLARRPQ